MKKITNKIKKMAIIVIALILNFLMMGNCVKATELNAANVYCSEDCGSLLTYKGITVKVSYVEYNNNGVKYPAYCMDKTKPGAESGEYTVSVQNAVQDVGLWRRIINGYPYKSIQELGVSNKEEAFTATKQAIYCYIHGNNPDDYGAIGDAGQRTLNAMKTIISNANNSKETKISSTISINKNITNWEQDKVDNNYMSKTYSITAGANIGKYKIFVSKDNNKDLGGIKLTDLNGKEKSEFAPSEKFKIMIPIKNMTEKGTFNLNVQAQIKTKPVLYGSAPNSGYQDYALTAATYEDGTGTVKDEYSKNGTKIIIIKQDQETTKRIEGVEFELLDANKQVLYNNLKTDKDGKITINNIVPQKYYLREVKTIDGYRLYEDLIEVKSVLNEETTVVVNNKKVEEKPEIEVTTNSISATDSVRVLPVTGM